MGNHSDKPRRFAIAAIAGTAMTVFGWAAPAASQQAPPQTPPDGTCDDCLARHIAFMRSLLARAYSSEEMDRIAAGAKGFTRSKAARYYEAAVNDLHVSK